MKKNYILLIFGIVVPLIILLSCNGNQINKKENQAIRQKSEKEKPVTKTLEEIKAEELATGVKNDTVLFGLYFGMPREKVILKLQQLEKEKWIDNLVIDEIPLASYKLAIKDYNLMGLLVCGFYNNELSIVRLNFDSPQNATLSSYQTYEDLRELYETKYGRYYEEHLFHGDFGYWINGNREVRISRLDDPDGAYCMITYQDTEREQLQKNEKQEESINESSKTKEEI